MPTSIVKYLGDLRTECTHINSGKIIVTDAPVDNNGKGDAFSPTDLAATSLAACMITIMGVSAKAHNFSIDGCYAEVTKVMSANPRKISEVIIDLFFPENNFSENEKKIIEHISKTCPVALSLADDVKQTVHIHYQ